MSLGTDREYYTEIPGKKPLDLTKLLQGYEGQEFWSPVWGKCVFLEIHSRDGGRPSLKFKTRSGNCRNVTPRGILGYENEGCGGRCIIWPSEENQSWDNWKIKDTELWMSRGEDGKIRLYSGDPKNSGRLLVSLVDTELFPQVTQKNSPVKFIEDERKS